MVLGTRPFSGVSPLSPYNHAAAVIARSSAKLASPSCGFAKPLRPKKINVRASSSAEQDDEYGLPPELAKEPEGTVDNGVVVSPF
jgi:hypothetical protein